VKRANHAPSFIGEIILENLIDRSVLVPFKAYLVSSRIENVQNFVPSRWHIHRYRMSLDQVQALILARPELTSMRGL